jgi:hypothetical protein
MVLVVGNNACLGTQEHTSRRYERKEESACLGAQEHAGEDKGKQWDE